MALVMSYPRKPVKIQRDFINGRMLPTILLWRCYV
jgi:hypothetical protein